MYKQADPYEPALSINTRAAIPFMPGSSGGFPLCQLQFFPRRKKVFRVLPFIYLRFLGMQSACRP